MGKEEVFGGHGDVALQLAHPVAISVLAAQEVLLRAANGLGHRSG
jgi:hypothetical protein